MGTLPLLPSTTNRLSYHSGTTRGGSSGTEHPLGNNFSSVCYDLQHIIFLSLFYGARQLNNNPQPAGPLSPCQLFSTGAPWYFSFPGAMGRPQLSSFCGSLHLDRFYQHFHFHFRYWCSSRRQRWGVMRRTGRTFG